VLSGKDLCYGLVTRPGRPIECGVSECDREASKMRRPRPTRAVESLEKKNIII
jgi:hypothetical protein